MFYSMSSQMYKYEHGLSAIEQRAEMARASEIAAGVRDLRLRLGCAFRFGHRLQPVRRAAGTATAPAPCLPGTR